MRIVKEPEVRKKEILDAAEKLFAAKGYEAATMRLPALKAKLDPQFCSWQICFKFWEKLDCT